MYILLLPLFSLFLHVQIHISFGKMQGLWKKPDAVWRIAPGIRPD
jgi:hypothetical protein